MGQDVEKEYGSVDLRGDHPNGDSEERSESGGLKSCTDCRTTKTPLWRGGPSGPKSLCNACGIRWRKKRREILGLKDGAAADKDKSKSKDKKKNGSSGGIMSVMRIDVLVKQKKRSSLLRLKRRGISGEEEEAAFLLMALSSGLLYA